MAMKTVFVNSKISEIFSRLTDGSYGYRVAKEFGFGVYTMYDALKYFEELGLIERKFLKGKRGGKRKQDTRRRVIFLTEKGKRVQELIGELKILTEIEK